MKEENERTFSLYEIEKRIIDIFLSSIAIIIFSPIMLIVAIKIKTDGTHGPVFADMPKRVGRYGKMFVMFKFRSMFPNAHTIMRTDPKYKELYAKYQLQGYKLGVDEDPRITKIGRFIRKTSIDEFPQFFNIFRGEMSMVGPRAYFMHELEEQSQHYPQSRKLIKQALLTKPGLTGPWQVSGRNDIKFSQRIKLDAEYAKKKSILYDMSLIIKTPSAVLSGKGVK